MNKGMSHNNDQSEVEDDCPLNLDTGDHRYFIFKTLDWFEPYTEFTGNKDGTVLYHKVEYAILGCNCGSVIKKEVIRK